MEENDTREERTLFCPVCGTAMIHDTVSRVEVDVCEEHGMWLDAGELERIRFNKHVAGRKRRGAQLKKMRHKARVEGWLGGISSLWNDD